MYLLKFFSKPTPAHHIKGSIINELKANKFPSLEGMPQGGVDSSHCLISASLGCAIFNHEKELIIIVVTRYIHTYGQR